MNALPRLRTLVALGAVLLLSGCTATLLQFLVPLVAFGGSTVEVVVVGTHSNGQSGDRIGAVLQLPPGIAALGAMTPNGDIGGNPIPVTWNEPGLLGLYTEEPGSTLVAFSGTASSPPANPLVLRVRLQLPPGAAVHQLKVALAGSTGPTWAATDPPGVTSFGSITSAPHVQVLVAADAPAPGTPAWAEDVSGLPLYDNRGWGGVAFGDVDGDGRDDLGCVARLGGAPKVLRHGSSGWLDASTGLTGSSGRSDVAFGDFNADGVLDFADGNGRCYLGNGGTSWVAASTGIVSFGSEGVAVGDVNHDGFDDVAFAGHFSPRLECYLSQGNGSWVNSSAGLPTTQPASAAQAGGHKLLMRDLNGDGNLDLVWARIQAPGIWLGNGQGGWTEVVSSGLDGFQFWGVDAADFNGDGLVDLVFGAFSYPSGVGSGPLGVRLYLQQPGPTWAFAGSTGLPSVSGYMDIAVADFDRDGLLDIAAGRSGGTNSGIEIWQGLPGTTFAAAPFASGLPAGYLKSPEGIAVGDVNGDSFPDLAVASYGLGVAVYQNQLTGFSRFGAGCRGASAFLPAIGGMGAPVVGSTTFAWTVGGAPPGSLAVVVLGLSKRYFWGAPVLPLSLAPLGAPGCALLVDDVMAVATLTDASGAAAVGMSIPAVPSLVWTPVFGQWGIFHAPANPLGLLFSDGGAARLGS